MKYVKILALLFGALMLSENVWSQFSVGLKSSFSRAWQDYGDTPLPENAETDIAAFQFSVLANYRLNNYLQIGLRPGLARRGAACVPGFNPFIGDTKWNLNYLELPMIATGNVHVWQNRISLMARTGFGVSHLLSGYQVDEDFPDDRLPLDLGPFSGMNRFDMGFYNGLGVGWNIQRMQLFIEMDHYYGLRDAAQFQESKNRGLSWGMGILINL
ncbi:MAG: outer membrane beta-barrel protein [Bacteroidota bacterium]